MIKLCGCGKKKQTNQTARSVSGMKTRGASETEILYEATDGDEFVYAIYNGPSYPHHIPSATGVIRDYGILNYGVGKKGDKIKVHKLDLDKAIGRLYLPVDLQGEDEMPNNGNEGIRGPEPIDENVFIAEYESNKRINAQLEEAANTAKDEAKDDLIELSKRSNAAKKAKAEETGEANVTEKIEQKDTVDANKDNVPDQQQETTSRRKRTRKSEETKPEETGEQNLGDN